ncbi:centromere protein I, partial [Silurus asotus]
STVQEGTVVRGNNELEKNLVVVETVAFRQGLPPDAISQLLDLALSLRAGGVTCLRILKFLIPASVVPQEAIVRSVSWLCVGKMNINAQVLFLRWVLTVFDLIDCKDRLRSIYGFIFSFVTEENLCPFVCHLLYLLTIKEHVQPYRVRKLMDIQAKMVNSLLFRLFISLPKKFLCTVLIFTSDIPAFLWFQAGFKNYNSTWKAALSAVQKRNRPEAMADLSLSLELKGKSTSRKRKLHHLEVPGLSSAIDTGSDSKVLRMQELQSFAQLLQNIHNIELPAQMGSLLGSSSALHYLDCVQDESAFLRLNFWLGHSLQEEFLLCPEDGGLDSISEASAFLTTILSSQQFLQESFLSTESFLYKFLSVWDGSLLRSQILGLLSHIPPMSSNYIKMLVFEPLIQLYFTSNVFFKCSVIECLNSMLLRWLTCHFVNRLEDCADLSVNTNTTATMDLSGFVDTVTELVSFVGRLATEGLRLENCHILLLNHTLNFYETVCDMLVKYELPLVIMPPAGVFYPALFATDSLTVDRLGYIMYRYRKNLTLAKKQEQQNGVIKRGIFFILSKLQQTFHISRATYQDFNKQLVVMVSCLWNSKSFSAGTSSEIDEHLLIQSKVPKYRCCFDLVHHPAFFKYAIEFHQKCWPERTCVDLASIKVGRYWSWYVEFLFCQGFDGLNYFIQVNTGQSSSSSSS